MSGCGYFTGWKGIFEMIIDLHNHSTWSRDGSDTMEALVENAIQNGIDVIGVSDHNYWIGKEHLAEYRQAVYDLREKYKGSIKVLCGIEYSLINTAEIEPEKLDEFDYCLFEYYNHVISTEEMMRIRNRTKCPAGIAHLDGFALSESEGVDVIKLWSENDVFWELNMNKDEIHGYSEHQYCKNLMSLPEQQQHIKKCGIKLSVGFDTHMLKDYDVNRIKSACDFIENNGFSYPEFVF